MKDEVKQDMANFRDYFAYNRDTDQSERMAIPEWALAAGFEDASYSNDVAAQMTLKSNPWIALFVSEEHPLNREYPDEPRYGLGVFPLYDGDTGEAEFFLKSDDEAEILAFLASPPPRFTAMAAPGAEGAADRPKPIRCASEHCHQEVQPVPAGLDPSLCALCNAEAAEEKFEAERKAWARRHGIAQRMVTVTVASEDGEVLDQFEVRHWQDEDMGEDAEGVWSGAAEGLLTARIRRYVHDGQ